MQKDVLTIGPISSHFRSLAVPAAFGMLFATLYNVVDVYFAGMLGTEAQAGLVIGYQAFFVMMAVGFGLGSSLSALVSNAKGRKDISATQRLAAQGISFGILASALLLIVGIFSGPFLIAAVSETGAYQDAAFGYFNWLLISLPAFLMAYGMNGILQSHGDTVSLQRGLMVAFLANICLNPLFIFGIPGLWNGMGFNGIAVATILSQTGVMVWILRRVFALDIMKGAPRDVFMPKWDSFREIIAQMLPTTTALLVMFISGFVVQFALKGFGGEALAAYGVALRIEQILLLPVLGMTGALLPIAGQNFGAGDHDRVRQAVWFCWKTGFIMAAFALPMLWFGGQTAVGLFTQDPVVIEIGASYLRVDAILFPIYMMLFSINSILQALKKPIWTLWISIYRQGLGVALFIWIFVGLLNFDVVGVWLGIAVAVSTGWLLSLLIAVRVGKSEIGGLLRAH
jgi:putative MATE family efflux protein